MHASRMGPDLPLKIEKKNVLKLPKIGLGHQPPCKQNYPSEPPTPSRINFLDLLMAYLQFDNALYKLCSPAKKSIKPSLTVVS